MKPNKEEVRLKVFAENWINVAWTEKEKKDRREFYGKSGVRVF